MCNFLKLFILLCCFENFFGCTDETKENDESKAANQPESTVTYKLTIQKTGTGTATIKSNNLPGISCGTDCEESYSEGTTVTLEVVVDSNSIFDGWSGEGCSGTATTCTLTMDQARTVKAGFSAKPDTYALTINKSGNGKGTVSSATMDIDCGSDCGETYTQGTVVTLTATAAKGSSFAGWSGEGCSGTDKCVLTLSHAADITAGFSLNVATALSATVIAQNITLTWKNPSNRDLTASIVTRTPMGKTPGMPENGKIYSVASDLGDSTVVYVGDPSSLAFVDHDLVPDTYVYQIWTRDDALNWQGSALQTATIVSPTLVLEQPTEFIAPMPPKTVWLRGGNRFFGYPAEPEEGGAFVTTGEDLGTRYLGQFYSTWDPRHNYPVEVRFGGDNQQKA